MREADAVILEVSDQAAGKTFCILMDPPIPPRLAGFVDCRSTNAGKIALKRNFIFSGTFTYFAPTESAGESIDQRSFNKIFCAAQRALGQAARSVHDQRHYVWRR
jgi:hypothetical protein